MAEDTESSAITSMISSSGLHSSIPPQQSDLRLLADTVISTAKMRWLTGVMLKCALCNPHTARSAMSPCTTVEPYLLTPIYSQYINSMCPV